jgi:tetratricopeptide (TPR) repeat protein
VICPRCQTANPDEHRYCPQCGTRLIERGGALGGSLRDQLHRGLALLVDGEWAGARTQFARCLALDPTHGASLLYLGLIDCLEGAPGRAREHLARAVTLDPELVNAWLLLGLMAESEEDFAEAARCYRESVARQGGAHLANQRLAFLALARGDRDEALPYLRAWLEGQRAETAPLLHLSAALLELGNESEAAATLDRALALEPEAPALHRRRGDLCLRMGQKREAAAHYQEALAAEPREVETRVKYGVTLASLGEVDRAIAALEQALEQDPDRADASYELGVLYYTELGDLDRALAAISRALELTPQDATARMIYQELLLEQGLAEDEE